MSTVASLSTGKMGDLDGALEGRPRSKHTDGVLIQYSRERLHTFIISKSHDWQCSFTHGAGAEATDACAINDLTEMG